MIDTLFYISNSYVNPPKNWEALGIELNYGKDQFPEGNVVSITDLEWVRENYDLLKKYIDAGLTGDVGITEAPPLRIDITDGTTTKTVFNGYLDLTQIIIKDRIQITAKAVSNATVDWINSIANGFTFEFLASLAPGTPGAITSDMYRFMPYVNNSVPNYEQSAICSLMVFNIVQTIIKEIEEIANLAAEAGGYFTTIPAIIKFILKIAYLILLLITLIKLILDIIKFIISPVKYHAGMYVRDLMSKAVEYISNGTMDFVSEIWEPTSDYYNEFIIPEKLYNAPSKSDSSLLGFLVPDKNEQVGWYKGTFGKLLESMKTKYNAKVVVSSTANGGTVYLLRRDKNALPPEYQLPGIYQPEYTFNINELPANYSIEYQTDSLETNTLQNYAGTIYQVICEQKKVNYRPFVMLKNYVSVSIPFARASAKTGLTTPELIIKDLLIVFDAIDAVIVTAINILILSINIVIKVINKIVKFLKTIGLDLKFQIKELPYLQKSNLAASIENRIGMMVLHTDHFNVPKIFILNEGSDSKYNKINPNNANLESARAMWDGFHYVNSFIPAQLNSAYSDRPTGNQYLIKSFQNVPFTWDDFLKVFANNRIYDADGNEAILESLKFFPPNPKESGKANIKARFGKIFTVNLQETFLDPTGA